MLWFIAGVVTLVIMLLIGQWFTKANPRSLAVTIRRLGGLVLIGAAILVGIRGNIGLAAPLAVFGWFTMTGRPVNLFYGPFRGMGGGTSRSAGQSSTVETDTIRMTLDHDTGEMDGTVIKGRFAGKTLSSMAFGDLTVLFESCRPDDVEAAKVLEAYLDRMHSDSWHAYRDGADEGVTEEGARKARPSSGDMSVDEAFATLGLAVGATREEVKEAHHRLMKKLHPDQGGSTYLASKINQAKDVLLRHL